MDSTFSSPNAINQEMLRESFLLEDLVELMGFIWPDEHYLRQDFADGEEEEEDEGEDTIQERDESQRPPRREG